MKKITFILIMFLVVLSTGIGIVSAETLTGTLGATGVNSTIFTLPGAGTTTPHRIAGLRIVNFENTGGFMSLVQWNTGNLFSFDVGAPPGAQTGVSVYMTNSTGPELDSDGAPRYKGRLVGTGTIAYQRIFNQAVPPIEQPQGYVLIYMDTWDLGNETGTKYLALEYNFASLYNVSFTRYSSSTPTNIPGFIGANYILEGDTNTYNKRTDTLAEYSATKPKGIGISGNITKTVGGTIYNSRGYVFNPAGTQILASDTTSNPTTFLFNVPNDTIMLGIRTPDNIWYNSSTLFSPGGVTPTPTPVPGTTIPAGYIRTTLNIWDRSGAMIHGANIQLKDIEAGVWSNSTSDADGIHFIDTPPGHTVNMYSDYTVFSNEFLPGSLLAQEAGYNYFITLFPYESGASAGNVSLYVEVKDMMGSFIPYANVQITLPTGYSYSGSTANAGSKVFIVPNNTQIRATGTASGYLPATIIADSGSSSGGTTTITIELTRQIVTTAPTSTVPPGGVTPAVTFDSRSINQKDADMMGQIRDAGPDLISLAIVVTMISLLGLMMKGFK